YSNQASLDAYSVRIDDKLSEKVTLFGRYNYSPSKNVLRGSGGSLSTVSPTEISTQTVTLGSVWMLSPVASNDLRFNYSRTNASNYSYFDNFGGAVPLPSVPFPSPYSTQNAGFIFFIFSLQDGNLTVGQNQNNLQRQINFVDAFSVRIGSHSLKLGMDYRRLSPRYGPFVYLQEPLFLDVPSALSGEPLENVIFSGLKPTFLFRNL